MVFLRFCAVACCVLALALSGCEEVESVATDGEAIEDAGDFVLEYQPVKDPELQSIQEILESSEFYEGLVADLNETFALPQDVLISFDACGEENAYYDAENAQITMCYELIRYYADAFAADEERETDYETEVLYAGFFTFFHELGHALVDQYQLPIVGREEDAVDNFAAILLTESEEEDAVIAAIEQFDLDAAAEAEEEDLAFWDEHSLSVQRGYNMTCLLYGSDPESYQDWVEADWLPEERAEQCEAEYEQAINSWETLLAPYRKS